MGEKSRVSKGNFVAILTLVVTVFSVGYMVWSDQKKAASAKESEPVSETKSTQEGSAEAAVESPKGQSDPEIVIDPPWRAKVDVTRGVWQSQDWDDQPLARIRVAASDDGAGSVGAAVGVELDVMGSDPCRLVLAPGQDGICGKYAVTLVELTPETANLALAER